MGSPLSTVSLFAVPVFYTSVLGSGSTTANGASVDKYVDVLEKEPTLTLPQVVKNLSNFWLQLARWKDPDKVTKAVKTRVSGRDRWRQVYELYKNAIEHFQRSGNRPLVSLASKEAASTIMVGARTVERDACDLYIALGDYAIDEVRDQFRQSLQLYKFALRLNERVRNHVFLQAGRDDRLENEENIIRARAMVKVINDLLSESDMKVAIRNFQGNKKAALAPGLASFNRKKGKLFISEAENHMGSARDMSNTDYQRQYYMLALVTYDDVACSFKKAAILYDVVNLPNAAAESYYKAGDAMMKRGKLVLEKFDSKSGAETQYSKAAGFFNDAAKALQRKPNWQGHPSYYDMIIRSYLKMAEASAHAGKGYNEISRVYNRAEWIIEQIKESGARAKFEKMIRRAVGRFLEGKVLVNDVLKQIENDSKYSGFSAMERMRIAKSMAGTWNALSVGARIIFGKPEKIGLLPVDYLEKRGAALMEGRLAEGVEGRKARRRRGKGERREVDRREEKKGVAEKPGQGKGPVK